MGPSSTTTRFPGRFFDSTVGVSVHGVAPKLDSCTIRLPLDQLWMAFAAFVHGVVPVPVNGEPVATVYPALVQLVWLNVKVGYDLAGGAPIPEVFGYWLPLIEP